MILLRSALAAGIAVFATQASALTVTTSSVGGAPEGTNLVNFDNLSAGPAVGLTATGPSGSVKVTTSPDGQVATLPNTSQYAAPYLSGSNGLGFGPGGTDQGTGQDSTPYLTSGLSGVGGSVALEWTTGQLYMGLLWGSVDDYNTLSFYRSNGTLIGTITGTQVLATADGDQGPDGTVYANILSSELFYKVVATSTSYAFEFDNVAYSERNPAGEVPLPAAVWLFGSALAGTGFLARRRRKQQVVTG